MNRLDDRYPKLDFGLILEGNLSTNKQRPVKDRLLPVVLLIRAVAKALVDVPDLNAWWDKKVARKIPSNYDIDAIHPLAESV